MPDNDLSEEKYIEGQLEALEGERKAIQEEYDAGNVSEKEYLAAQIKEHNQQSQDKSREQTYERKRDRFND